MTRTLIEIDALIAADKALFGSPDWIEDGPIARLASAIVDASGSVIGGLSLRLNAPVLTPLQRGNAVLILDGQPVQRLSFRPDHVHVNGTGPPYSTSAVAGPAAGRSDATLPMGGQSRLASADQSARGQARRFRAREPCQRIPTLP